MHSQLDKSITFRPEEFFNLIFYRMMLCFYVQLTTDPYYSGKWGWPIIIYFSIIHFLCQVQVQLSWLKNIKNEQDNESKADKAWQNFRHFSIVLCCIKYYSPPVKPVTAVVLFTYGKNLKRHLVKGPWQIALCYMVNISTWLDLTSLWNSFIMKYSLQI